MLKDVWKENMEKQNLNSIGALLAVFTEEGSAQATINILRSCSPFSCCCALFSFIIGVCSLHLYPLAIMIMSIMLALCFCVFQLYTFCVFHCLHKRCWINNYEVDQQMIVTMTMLSSCTWSRGICHHWFSLTDPVMVYNIMHVCLGNEFKWLYMQKARDPERYLYCEIRILHLY